MAGRKARGRSVLLNENCKLGWSIHAACQKSLTEFEESVDHEYTWIQEVLVAIKKSFSSPEVQLCPKTPSAKRTRTAKAKKPPVESINEEVASETTKRTRVGRGKKNNDTADDLNNSAASTASVESMDCDDSVRSTRSTRSTRATSANVKSGGKNTRNKRNKKAQNTTVEEEDSASGPVLNILAKAEDCDDEDQQDNNLSKDREINKNIVFSPEVIILDTESDGDTLEPPRKRSKSRKSEDVTDESSESMEEVIQSTPETVTKASNKKVEKLRITSSKNSLVKKSTRSSQSTEISPPKSIPNYEKLSVKAKAQAYETYVNNSFSETGNESVSKIQKPVNKQVQNVVSEKLKNRTPSSGGRGVMGASPVLGKPLTRSTPQRGYGSYTGIKPKQTASKNTKRKSSTSGITAVKSGVKVSLSKRRSSIMRHKVRNELHGRALSKKSKEMANESIKSSPEKSPPSKKCLSTSGPNNLTKHYATPTKSSAAKNTPVHYTSSESPEKSTRSKLKLNKKPIAQSTIDSSDENCGTPKANIFASEKLAAIPGHSSTDSDIDTVDGTPEKPQRTTRSKMRKNQAPPSLPTPPSDEDDETPIEMESDEVEEHSRSTRSKMRKMQEESPSYLNESSKRPRVQDSDENSPPKRQCIDRDNSLMGTPLNRGPRILKPLKGATYSGSAGRKLVNLNTTAQSFVNRNTPKKKTIKDAEEDRRKMLAQKEKQARSRLLQREEHLQKKRDELKKNREERQKQVAKRREEQDKKEKDVKIGIVKKMESTKELTSKVLEEKLKEEREKQKLREKKVIEAELRRKQEEEQRIQALHDKEIEQKRYEEMLQRKREQEEHERIKKAEQKRLEEQRRLELEKERQREEERKRAILEEQRRHKEEAERRERDERDRREKQEREKYGREKHEEIERRKALELQKLKEAERQKHMLQKVKEQAHQKQNDEERKVLAMIQKHNDSLQQGSSVPTNTSHNTSQNMSYNKSTLNYSQNSTNVSKMNSSYTLPKPINATLNNRTEECSDSYELTPVRKYKNNSNSENYNIEDIKSDDSTDDEDKPRKKIPSWATGAQLKAALISQYYQPPNLDDIFEQILLPDLNVLFVKKRARFNKRTSSAIWDSPILKPSGLPPSPT